VYLTRESPGSGIATIKEKQSVKHLSREYKIHGKQSLLLVYLLVDPKLIESFCRYLRVCSLRAIKSQWARHGQRPSWTDHEGRRSRCARYERLRSTVSAPPPRKWETAGCLGGASTSTNEGSASTLRPRCATCWSPSSWRSSPNPTPATTTS
jgi:hypothetical protein